MHGRFVGNLLSLSKLEHQQKFISVFNEIDAQNLFYNKFHFMPLHVSSTCAHHQKVKIALHSLWYKTYCETNFVHQVG